MLFDELISAWISLFTHSYKTRALQPEQTGRAMKSFSATQWWSLWEVIDQVLEQFGNIDPFLMREDIRSPVTLFISSEAFSQIQATVARKCIISRWNVADYGKHFES